MIRFGIIGCGDVTEVKSGPALSRAPNSQLVAVMRRDATACADYARRHKISRWTTDADEILNDSDIDAVYVATPPDTHRDFALRALDCGKHVLIEKPMALSVDECDQIVEAADRNQRAVAVAFYRRALPRFEKMRRLIQDGAIGEPRSVLSTMHRASGGNDLANWRLSRQVNGGGLFVDMQVHVLDWLQHVFGVPQAVAGVATNQARAYDAEDTVSASIAYADGVVASFDCCFESDRDEQFVRIRGTRGQLEMPFLKPGALELRSIDHDGAVQSRSYAIDDPPHVHEPFVAQFVSHLLGDTENPCSAEIGRDNIRTLRAILDG